VDASDVGEGRDGQGHTSGASRGGARVSYDPRFHGIQGELDVSEASVEPGSFRALRLDRSGDVLRVAIDHPDSELNAVDGLLHGELTRLFHELKRGDPARAVLLTGRGRAFSAGGDFRWFPSLDDLEKLEHLRRDAKQMIWDLLDVQMPIVAAVNGPAVGLGASLALLCDVIFMADTATIADPHVQVGIVAGDGGAVIWPLALGPARAKQYLLTGDRLEAAEAERIGLVNRVVPAATLEQEALAFAKRLAEGAPLAVQYTKQAVNKLVKDALNVAFDTSTALEIVTFQSEDHREALTAIREKRKPRFRGR
jgi:enoyl-CoA hydratase